MIYSVDFKKEEYFHIHPYRQGQENPFAFFYSRILVHKENHYIFYLYFVICTWNKLQRVFLFFHRFNYRATAHMVKHGYYNFLNWFDERAWYPLGRIVGGTVYPGLMVTSGSIHYILNMLNIPVHIRDICVFLAPIFR